MSLDLAQIRAQLQPEQLRRFEAQMSRVEASIEEFQAQQTANLLRIGQTHLTIQSFPPGHPGYALNRSIVRRHAYSRADTRALIRPEIIERQER